MRMEDESYPINHLFLYLRDVAPLQAKKEWELWSLYRNMQGNLQLTLQLWIAYMDLNPLLDSGFLQYSPNRVASQK